MLLFILITGLMLSVPIVIIQGFTRSISDKHIISAKIIAQSYKRTTYKVTYDNGKVTAETVKAGSPRNDFLITYTNNFKGE